MKKLFYVAIFFFLLSSCSILNKKNDLEERDQYITDKKKNSHLIDLCASENMPRYPFRPKLYPQELRNLSDEQMDQRIKKHIRELDEHIDKVENVVAETRKRVEICR